MRDWKDFEEHVKHVYEMLLNLKDEGIMVAHNVQLRGRDGLNHQIDVYYEFEKAGIRHRVAIECKKTSRPVEINDVKAFKSTVDDIIGVTGVMVAENGYQSGAKKYAEDNGIMALELHDLPSIGMLLGARIKSVALPDETAVGEPFWTLYEVRDGKNTGSPYGQQKGDEIYSFLFFSKKQATDFLNEYGTKGFAVRGLPQRCLRAFILTVDALRGRYVMMGKVDADSQGTKWIGQEISRSDLIEEFYVASNPIPAEPLVMPSRVRAGPSPY